MPAQPRRDIGPVRVEVVVQNDDAAFGQCPGGERQIVGGQHFGVAAIDAEQPHRPDGGPDIADGDIGGTAGPDNDAILGAAMLPQVLDEAAPASPA
ncbi:hypothetical protein GCM10011505_31120 [Tistrella bauzanensis]|uniref:Uncharacterized protein n=1 Tax=Tistrella bauzanensis TaxID=657419 RepID=A0ABQ1IMV1_9PROT|nr:hypothetical protein GCM10011505_31120 [Tistrella bauzanensis]